MAFLDLHEGILDEFSAAAERYDYSSFAAAAQVRALQKRHEWIDAQCERERVRRAMVRRHRLAHREPCPSCGGPVTRDAAGDRTRGAPVPTYCSRKCMRAAVWRRYLEKNGDPRKKRAEAVQKILPPSSPKSRAAIMREFYERHPDAQKDYETKRREKIATDAEYAARHRANAAKRARACRARKRSQKARSEAA